MAKISRPKIQMEITIPSEAPDNLVLMDLMLNLESLLMSWMKSYLTETPAEPTLKIGIIYPGKKS